MKVSIAPDFEHLWPPPSAEELERLEANILADPKHERFAPLPVWVDAPSHTPNILLDGHNTKRIREKHHLKIKYVRLRFETRQEALDYAISAQLARRNLTASQRALAIAQITQTVREQHGGDRKSEEYEDQDLKLGLDRAAEMAGTSKATMEAAVAVDQDAAAAVKRGVEAGEFSASDAAAIAKLPKQKQQAAVRKVRAGKARTLTEAARPKTGSVNKSRKRIVAEAKHHCGRLYRLLSDLHLLATECSGSYKFILDDVQRQLEAAENV